MSGRIDSATISPQEFFSSRLTTTSGKAPEKLSDGSLATERLGDGILSTQDYDAIKADYATHVLGLESGAPLDKNAEAAFNRLLSGVVDSGNAQTMLDAVSQLASHDAEANAIKFKEVNRTTSTSTVPTIGRLNGVEAKSYQPGKDHEYAFTAISFEPQLQNKSSSTGINEYVAHPILDYPPMPTVDLAHYPKDMLVRFGTTDPQRAIQNIVNEIRANKLLGGSDNFYQDVVYDKNLSKDQYGKDVIGIGDFEPTTGRISVGNAAFASYDRLKDTLVHELVHRRQWVNGQMFKMKLGHVEIQAYKYTKSLQTQLGLSAGVINNIDSQIQGISQHMLKKGNAYNQYIPKPPNYTTLIKPFQ